MQFDELSSKILSCAITVHRTLGPGLLESAYERCLLRELQLATIPVQNQVPVDLEYKGLSVPNAYCADIIVDHKILVELKAVECFTAEHTAQILTYLRLTKIEVGLLLNFNRRSLKDGIRRFVLSQ
jgi:GxxExxY protein